MRTFQIARELQKMTVLENLLLIPHNQLGENLVNLWLTPAKVKEQETRNKRQSFGSLGVRRTAAAKR